MLKVTLAAFAVACFWGLSFEGSGHLQMAPYPLGKQIAGTGCNSSHDWLMSLAMDLAALCDCGGENGTSWCHLDGFNKI